MDKRVTQIASLACGAALIFLCMQMRSKGPVVIDSGSRVIMGTFANVIAVAAKAKTAQEGIEAAFREQRRIETLMNYHRTDSELSRMNREAFGKPIKVDRATFEVIQSAMHFSKLSDGAFDVTVGPLVDLWHSAADANSTPTEEELASAQAKVGWEKVVLDANEATVKFAVEGMKIDLGGIAKGYAVDKSVEAMKKCGVLGGVVDIGGNIRCFGKPPAGKKTWLIGVQDPNAVTEDFNRGKPLMVLEMTNEAVATSGHYRRFVTVQGRRQSHIIDPHTGSGSDKLVSVTIIAPDAMTADALSTAVSVMGAEKGFRLVEGLESTEAILVTGHPEQKIVKTSGAQKYIRSDEIAFGP